MSQTLIQIQALPEVAKSSLRELQWGVDWFAKEYSEASFNSKTAWEIYQLAVDEQVGKDEINDLFAMAKMFDEIKRDTWHMWQDLKRDYLALMN